MTDSPQCRCGHGRAAHEHFRSGSDCGACGAVTCARFRRHRPWHRDVVVPAATLAPAREQIPVSH